MCRVVLLCCVLFCFGLLCVISRRIVLFWFEYLFVLLRCFYVYTARFIVFCVRCVALCCCVLFCCAYAFFYFFLLLCWFSLMLCCFITSECVVCCRYVLHIPLGYGDACLFVLFCFVRLRRVLHFDMLCCFTLRCDRTSCVVLCVARTVSVLLYCFFGLHFVLLDACCVSLRCVRVSVVSYCYMFHSGVLCCSRVTMFRYVLHDHALC